MVESALPFKVVQCSSEDPSFPVVSLCQSSDKSSLRSKTGWASTDYAPIPQEITLALEQSVFISTIELLCHPYYIPTKIELYLGSCPSTSSSPTFISATFRRLGYFSLSSNEHTKHKAREFKRVPVGSDAQFIRFILHRPYQNELNLANKLGLVSVTIKGYKSQDSSRPIISDGSKLGAPSESIQPVVDSTTASQIKRLIKEKNKAITVEDYDKAEELKMLIEKFRTAGEEIQRLEVQKSRAVAVEDFKLAKKIKNDIDDLRLSLGAYNNSTKPKAICHQSPKLEVKSPMKILDNSPINQAINPPINQPFTDQTDEESLLNPFDQSFSSPVQHPDDRPIRPAKVLSPDPLPIEKESSPPKGRNEVGEKALKPGNPNMYDLAVDSVEGLNTTPFLPDQKPKSDDVPKLTSKDRETVGDVLALVDDDDIPALLVSKQWHHRVKAAQLLSDLIPSTPSPSIGYLRALELLAQDKHANVLGHCISGKLEETESIEFAGSLFQSVLNNALQLAPPLKPVEFSNLIKILIHRSGESNLRVANLSKRSVKIFSLSSPERAELVVSCGSELFIGLVEKTRNQKKNFARMSKAFCAPLLVIIDAVDVLPQSSLKTTPITTAINNLISASALHSAPEVRNLSLELMKRHCRVAGKRNVIKLLPEESELKPEDVKLLKFVLAALDSIEDSSAPNPDERPIKPQKKVGNVVKNEEIISQQKVAKKGEKQRKREVPVEEIQNVEQEVEKEIPKPPTVEIPPSPALINEPDAYQIEDDLDFNCDYCGFAFAAEKDLDLHWFNVCPYMTSCPSCQQIIPIELLNLHLLQQCDKSNSYRECEKCHEAVAKKKYNHHFKWGNCKPPKHGKFLRCVLCHQNVDADSWHEHVEEKCLENERVPSFQKLISGK
ncbi:hypothetical protein P9112_002590 [Eukaryota sp. TZLM1-RC]